MLDKLVVSYLVLSSFFSSTWSLQHERLVESTEDYSNMISDAHVSYDSTSSDPSMWDDENNPYKDNPGNEPNCDLCISGEPPERWWTIAAVLHVGTGTCKDLYWAGRSKRIPGRMCYPAQNELWKPCGCPCEDGAIWHHEIKNEKKNYFCSVKEDSKECGVRNTGVTTEDAKIEYRCTDDLECINNTCTKPEQENCADGNGLPFQGGGGLICRLNSGAACDRESLNVYRSTGDYFLTNPCGTELACYRGFCARKQVRDRKKDKLPLNGRIRGGG